MGGPVHVKKVFSTRACVCLYYIYLFAELEMYFGWETVAVSAILVCGRGSHYKETNFRMVNLGAIS